MGTSTSRAGLGTAAHGGCVADVGHIYACGNTEEHYHLKILGCKACGHPGEGPFDHSTGRGWVKTHPADYKDAIHVKKNCVVPIIVETLGGIGHRARKLILFSSRRAMDKKRGRDGTRYSRVRPAGFIKHHLRAISIAAVMGSARHALVEADKFKQRVFEKLCIVASARANVASA